MALAPGVREAGADDEAMEPGVEPVRVAQAGQVAPGGHERVLERILRPLDITNDPLREREQAIAPGHRIRSA